jgi:hypothetical protein
LFTEGSTTGTMRILLWLLAHKGAVSEFGEYEI